MIYAGAQNGDDNFQVYGFVLGDNDAMEYLAREAPAAELWRCTADLLYLMRNPVIREAFFPGDATCFAVWPSRRTRRILCPVFVPRLFHLSIDY